MSLYLELENALTIEAEIEKIASENDGVIPDELLQQLISAQSQSLQSAQNVVNYVAYLQGLQEKATSEVARIREIKKIAEQREEKIMRFLHPYIQQHLDLMGNGKKSFIVGTRTVGIRASKSVMTMPGFNNPEYVKTKIEIVPDKLKIKEVIENGGKVEDAWLESHTNPYVK